MMLGVFHLSALTNLHIAKITSATAYRRTGDFAIEHLTTTTLSGVHIMRRSFLASLSLIVLLVSLFAAPAPSALAQGPVLNAELNKSFTPISMVAGETTRLRVTIFNTNAFPLLNAAWNDNLIGVQPGIRIANPVNLVNTCGGAVVADPGATSLSLSGGTVPPQIGVTLGSCSVEVDVTSTTAGNLVNTIPSGVLTATGMGEPITNTTPASATLRVGVVQPPSLSKAFSPNTVYVGQASQLTITLRNTDLVTTLTQVSITDTLPSGVTISSLGTPALTACGASAALTAAVGSGVITLNNASIAPSTNCVIRVNVVSTTPSVYTNNIPVGAILSQQGVSNTALASAPLNVQPVGIAKAFSPATVQAGGISTLTITLRNPTGAPYTSVNLTDTLPSTPNMNLSVVAGSATTTCAGGTAAAVAPRSVTLTGGTIPPGTPAAPGSCTITVQVTSPAAAPAATYTNTIPIGALTATTDVSGLPVAITNNIAASANLAIYAQGTGISGASKAFSVNPILPGANTRLRISIPAPADAALTNFSITDVLPAGVTISNSTAASRSNCGAASVLTAPTGGDTITLTGGVINAGATCTIDVYVTSATGGIYVNSIPPANISNDQNRRPASAITATLTVRSLSGMTMSKAFYPTTVNPNGISTLTITLTNTNTSPLINVSLLDALPFTNSTNGVFAAPTPNISTTCGAGVVTATTVASQTQVQLTGGAIPAQVGGVPGVCTINIDVIGRGSASTRTNTIPVTNVSATISSTGDVIAPQAAATANLAIAPISIGVVKGFNPLTIFGGSASTLTIQLNNPTNAQLVGIAFSDTMPAGMIVANPPNLNVGTCGGALNTTPGAGSFSFSGGMLPPAGTCNLSLSATMLVNANLTNIIPVGAVTTTNGASNPQATQATLTNLPGASVSKVFSPNPVVAGLGNVSMLTITIQNTGNTLITGMGLVDSLPVGLQIAPAPAVVNNCGGTLTANVADSSIRLVGGSLPGSANCTLVIPVSGAAPGNYLNSIPAGALNNDQGATNTLPAEDTLVLTARPELNVTKTATSSGPYAAGSSLTYQIVVENTGNIALTGVTVTDPGVGVSLGVCAPVQPANLAPGATLTCPASYVLTPADMDAGSYTNTAIADSDQTGADSDSESVNLPPLPGIRLEKTGTLHLNIIPPLTTANPGDTITYAFTVTNTGNVTLSNITLADTVGGITISGGPIATLAAGASDSATFTGTYTLTQTDIESGTFTNTATASGNPPTGGPVTDDDDDTQTLPAAPELNITKTATSSGPYSVGSSVTYEIVVRNTGNITLTNVAVTDPGSGVTLGACSPAQPATLAPGDTLTCPASYGITQNEIDLGGYTNTAFADSDQTGADSDSETITIPPLAEIDLQKTGTLDLDATPPLAIANPGDTITYAFTVTNTGNVTLTNISLADTIGGVTISGGPVIASLAPGASDATSFTGTYTLTQADIDAGTFTNTATVSGNPPTGSPVTGSDDDTQTLPAAPGLQLVKTATSSGPYSLGSIVTYSIVATNTGNISLTNVRITDPGVGVSLGACTPAQPASLAPGATLTCDASYTLTQPDVDNGSYTNAATVASDEAGPATDSETITIPAAPALHLEKTGTLHLDSVAPDAEANPGDTITYAFTVTNTGNVTLTNITLADTIGGVTISGGPVAILAPGGSDSTTFTGTYTIAQADIDAGTFTNTATVSGNPPTGSPVTDGDDDTQTLPATPALDVTKTATSSGPYTAGSSVTYEIVVQNTGNVTLTNVTVTDPGTGVSLGTCTPAQPAALAPGSSMTCPASHLLTQAEVDAGSYLNTAFADSDQTGADSDDETVTIPPAAAIGLQKTGTLHMDDIAPDGEANPGDTITYAFTVTNTGNVTLTGITLADTIGGISLSGGPIATLAPGDSDSATFTGTYTLTQSDINAGTFTNTATVSGNPPTGGPVTSDDDDTQTLPAAPALGVAKRVVGAPAAVAPGVWDVTYAILVRNYGNLPLSALQVSDDLSATFPPATSFSVQTLTSTDFSVNPGFNGGADTDLLAGTDSLAVGASGSIQLVVRIIPAAAGPFDNTALASGQTPAGDPVEDPSQDGSNPDPDADGNPGNNNTPTPVDFGPSLFDPPVGVKTFDARRLPLLRWSVIWINTSNIVAINAVSSDAIPVGTAFVDDGVPSGYPLPTGELPAGSVASGVTCTDTSTSTTTTYCYYEGPSSDYPRGRVIWQGALGPDFGITDPELALNDINIQFAVRVGGKVERVANTATIDSDRNGDGDVDDGGERSAAAVSATWRRNAAIPAELPETGFAPGKITHLPQQPAGLAYAAVDDLTLEIPAIQVNTPIVSVPLTNAGWQLNWLGSQVGHLEGTAFPTWNGNSVLTAHVYDANGKPGPFVNLSSLRWGDKVVVRAFGQKYTYEVRSVRAQVDPKEAGVIRHEEQSWLTLVTCQGYDEKSDSYRWRSVVRAVLVKVE
jgi:LPXTG-site transpeptidase (sortase) family protein